MRTAQFSVSDEMIGTRWPSVTRNSIRPTRMIPRSWEISSHRAAEERCTNGGVLKMPDHTTGGIAADPGNPASGPPGETIEDLLDEAIFSTPEPGNLLASALGQW
ncbi:hypothetical protein BO94DRAFT_582347 [Aspergillus sclerotioniger CBS 115572]|uniref:Uncharacterized protein n=1 Tax=Aspergillus sclerotioniger CBS 115572 TaxID=1450535 RepID=A0A317XAF5_9EURO|nr:hypothetical protein BO94DRAFT_582347 [Aspergillus sclerotioniger CBS 115572]PWY93928.1 hypothetical protein BO94DRAFT_582347 [Aspergillus sclerotioniger CBS 115572]